jgi:hypothetical protein
VTQIYTGTQSAIALSAATTRTCAAIVAAASDEVQLIEMAVSFDGVTASAVPVLVELCDYDVTSTGTRTTGTPFQIRGQRSAVSTAYFHSYTGAEPTVLTPVYKWYVTPNGGLLHLQWPLGREPSTVIAKGLALRCTAPATVNVSVAMIWEE